jgi:excinuclease ABC subunit B
VQELEEFQQEAQGKHVREILIDTTDILLNPAKMPKMVRELEQQMLEAAENLQFELAAALRDKIAEIRQMAPAGSLKSAKN